MKVTFIFKGTFHYERVIAPRGLRCRHFEHGQVFVYFLSPAYLFKTALVSRTKPSELVKSCIKAWKWNEIHSLVGVGVNKCPINY